MFWLLFIAAPKPIVLMPTLAPYDAWTPLMMEALAEMGHQPLYPPALPLDPAARACRELQCAQEIAAALGAKQLVTARVGRDSGTFYLTLTLYDAVNQEELGRIERTWTGKDRVDEELVEGMRDLLEGKKRIVVQTVDETGAMAAVHAAPPPPEPRFRPAAISLTVVGGLALAGGATVLVLARLSQATYADNVRDYNARVVQSPAEHDTLVAQGNTVNTLNIASYVTLGVGAATLATGIGLLIAGTPDAPLALLPSYGGGTLVGRF